MARVVVFGTSRTTELAAYYLREDSEHEIAAFSVHREYLPSRREFLGLPVVPFETVESEYPPGQFLFFAPLTALSMNKLRARVYLSAKRRGYGFASYVSSHATVLTNDLGENCFILEDNTIQPFVQIGNNVVLWSGNHIGHHSVIEDHVFVSSHVVVSGQCRIGKYSFLGVNSSVRDSTDMARGTLLTMNSALVGDSERWSIFSGNPARKRAGNSMEASIYRRRS